MDQDNSNLNTIAKKFDLLGRIFIVAIAFVLPISTTLTDVFFYGAAICCILAGNWRDKWHMIVSNRVALCVIALFILFIIGVFYSSAGFSTSFGMLGKYSKLIIAVFFLPLLNDNYWRKLAVYAFLLAMLITLLMSYAIYFNWLPFYKPQGLAGSVFRDYLEQNLLMAFACYLFGLEILQNKKYRWLLFIILLLAIYNTLFISMGRTGYIVFAALFLLFVWQNFRRRGIVYGALCLILLIGLAFHFSETFKTRINEVTSNIKELHHGQANTSVGQRLTFDSVSMNLVLAHPVFGTGTGSFVKEYAKANKNADLNINVTNPHNEYLNIAVQLGLVGVVLFVLIFYYAWRCSYLLPKYSQFLAQAIALAMFIGCFANSWLMDSTPGHFFVYILMLAFSTLPYRNKMTAVASTD